MKFVTCLVLVLLARSSVFGQLDEEDCPSIPACCEEDCCGTGTSYVFPTASSPGGCFVDLPSTGWSGHYSAAYEMGCAARACCEANCCVPGTIYLPTPANLCVTPGSISGTVTGDSNNDNIGDVNLPDVPIKLLNSGGNVVIATTSTDANGNYVFDNVPPGFTYTVMQTNIVSFPFDVSDTDLGDANMISVTINAATGFNSTGNNFVDELARIITGVVLEDLDNNDSGDVPIPDVFIELIDAHNIVIDTTLTDSEGRFTFEAPPGIYTINQTNLPGFVDVSDTDTPAAGSNSTHP